MAAIQLESKNPKFSYLLEKNPASGMMLTSLRKGILSSWYDEQGRYNAYFEDASDEVSYKRYEDESFEYMNVSRYNSPLAYLNIINQLFSTALKVEKEYDESEKYTHSITVNMVEVQAPHYLSHFSTHFPQYKLTTLELANNNYRIIIESKTSFRELLNATALLFLLLVVTGDDNFYIDESALEKYIDVLNIIDAPYFIRYLFKMKLIRSPKLFAEKIDLLQKSDRYKIILTFGDTHQARYEFIRNLLLKDVDIIDYGCGEGYYVFKLARKYQDNKYYAVDVDEDIIQSLNTKLEVRGIDNVITSDSVGTLINHGVSLRGKQVIMSEVIEHMPSIEDAMKSISVLLDSDVEQIILTTPNADFNEYYFNDNQKRHEDHKFELSASDMWDLYISLESRYKEKYDIHVRPVGDMVNETCVSFGLIIRKK